MKPADFLLGLVEFFAVLLPGTVAAWLVTQHMTGAEVTELTTAAGQPLSETACWAVFLFAAYVLGHFVFMIGAYLDPLYDLWRRRSKPTERDQAFQAAKKVQEGLNANLLNADFTILKWAESYLQVRCPVARLDIDRLEAAEKFFRSFVIVGLLLVLHSPGRATRDTRWPRRCWPASPSCATSTSAGRRPS